MIVKTKTHPDSTTVHTSCGDVIILDVNGEVRVEVIPKRDYKAIIIDDGFDIAKNNE